MKDPRNKYVASTGFLFCPRCGLRKPKDDGSKECPNCGSKMIEEGPLPYVPKSSLNSKRDNKNRIEERSNMDRNGSIYKLMQKNQSDKHKQGLGCISAVEKADSGEYDDAIDEFTEAIRINPNDAKSYFARATLKVRIGDIEGARKDFMMCENYHHIANSKLEDYPLV
jgi:tetratricopeptide (TPR) repeat protein